MNRIKKYILGTLTVNDLVEYFHSMGVGFYFTFEKKQQPRYYARNSRMYEVNK